MKEIKKDRTHVRYECLMYCVRHQGSNNLRGVRIGQVDSGLPRRTMAFVLRLSFSL